MTLNRFAKRKDANQNELVAAAEQLGAIWITAPPLDGWIFWRDHWVPTEIKRPDGPRGGRSGRQYTPAQLLFLGQCKAQHAPVFIWRTVHDVMTCLDAVVTA